MAPNARKENPKEANFSNIGKVGRKTGLELKEGERDENGLEVLDGMFSSPEKQLPTNGLHTSNDTVTTSEDMMVQNSESYAL